MPATPTQLKKQNANLRRGKAEYKEMAEGRNRSRLGRFLGVAVVDAAAYGGSRLSVYLQQTIDGYPGWIDGAVGGVSQIVGAAVPYGGLANFLLDVGDGLMGGSLGRMAAFHQLEEIETDDGVGAYKKPGGPPTP